MNDVIRLFKLLIAAAIFLPLLWMASCAAIGVGTVKAVEAAANSDMAKEAVAEHKKHKVREANDQFNREASYANRYDDFGEPM